MPISCAVCGETFDQIIDWKHLQKHKMSVKKYQELYGANTAQDFDWAEFIKSKNQHRKGVKLSDEHRTKLKQSFQLREEKYRSGELTRPIHSVSEENRQLHSKRMIEFAKQNPEIVSERVKKAQATRKAGGSGNRAGAKLKEETKQQISKSLLIAGAIKQQQTLDKYREIAKDQNIIISNRDKTTLFLECNSCNTHFSRSLQLLQPNKFQEKLCPVCFPKLQGPTSKAETEIVDFLNEIGVNNIVTRCRDIITPRELDIFLPDHNLAIEYSGIYWHSELSGNKGQFYHQEKWQNCRNQNIQLLTIFDDEWAANAPLIKSMIKNKINKNIQNKIFARQCQISVIESKKSAVFLNQNHIHGAAAAQLHLGLYYNDHLVYVMTFTKNNISRRNTQTWEIQRMAGSIDTLVIGAASKLFSYFVKNYNPGEVISYADLRWFTGESYRHLGFKFVSNSKPGYWYTDKNYTTRKHRYSLRKNVNDNTSLTEWENRQAQGWDRIWDCGHAKWTWTKENGQD
jgi:hypothetical protein